MQRLQTMVEKKDKVEKQVAMNESDNITEVNAMGSSAALNNLTLGGGKRGS